MKAFRRAPGTLGIAFLLLGNACAHMPFRSSQKGAAAAEASSMAALQNSAMR